MPFQQRICVLLILTCLVSWLPFASAHGDEASSGLANYQILGISLLLALLAYPILNKKLPSNNPVFTPIIFSLAVFTGMVHVLLGINDRILLIGGIGVLGTLFFSITFPQDEKKSRLARIGLSGVTIVMFIGYFVSNHDLHYVLEDYLGIATKLSEIALLVGIYRTQPVSREEE